MKLQTEKVMRTSSHTSDRCRDLDQNQWAHYIQVFNKNLESEMKLFI